MVAARAMRFCSFMILTIFWEERRPNVSPLTVMTVNGETFGRLDPNKLRKILREQKNLAREAARKQEA